MYQSRHIKFTFLDMCSPKYTGEKYVHFIMTISVENCKRFPPRVFCAPTEGVLLGLELGTGAWTKKIMGSRKKFDDISSFLDIIHERKYVTDRSTDRTDGRTDKTARQQRPRLRIASRGKKTLQPP